MTRGLRIAFPATESSDLLLLQLGDSAADYPNIDKSNPVLVMYWENSGGDWSDAGDVEQGTTPFATALTDGTAKFIPFSCGSLIQKLLTDGNTGIYLMPINPALATGNNISSFASTRYSDSSKRPTLTVVTDVGTFTPAVTVSAWMVADENTLVNAPERLDNRSVLKADLSGVTGTVISATLTLYNYGGFAYEWGLFYLRMPTLVWDPANQIGGVEQGIAATVGQDTDLDGIAVFYPLNDSAANIRASWGLTSSAPAPIAGARNVAFVTNTGWEDYGLTACRMESFAISEGDPNGGTAGSGIASWKMAATSDDELWESDVDPMGAIEYTDGYTRYLLKLDPDVTGMNESGVKLPGGWSGRDSFANNKGFSMRLEHRAVSPANPDLYAFVFYRYDPANPLGTDGFGSIERIGTNMCLRADKIYCIEVRVKMNDIGALTGDVNEAGVPTYEATANGVYQVWIDGVKMYERLNAIVNNTDPRNCLGINWMNVYHGGVDTPFTPIHYELAGWCYHTTYVGPPKVIA